MYLLLLCQMRNINSITRGDCLGHKQAQLSTMHSKDFQTKVVQAFGPFKWSGPRLLSTVPWGINHISIFLILRLMFKFLYLYSLLLMNVVILVIFKFLKNVSTWMFKNDQSYALIICCFYFLQKKRKHLILLSIDFLKLDYVYINIL